MNDIPQSVDYDSIIPGHRYLHRSRLKYISELVSKAVEEIHLAGDKDIDLIEVGCGDGYVLREIGTKFPDIKLTGVDLSQTRLTRAKGLSTKASLIRGDALRIPFDAEAFEIVVCSEVIEHVPDDVALLKELHRVLKPGFFLILTTPNYYNFANRVCLMLGYKPGFGSVDHLREYSYNELAQKLTEAGFEISKFQSLAFYFPYIKKLFFKSKLMTMLMFQFSKLFPKLGRIFVVLARKQ